MNTKLCSTSLQTVRTLNEGKKDPAQQMDRKIFSRLQHFEQLHKSNRRGSTVKLEKPP